MNALRKIIAVLILLFVGMPILFGIIWGVGIAKGVLSSNFYKDLPQMVVSEIPELVNELIETAKKEPDSPDIDEETRKWLIAMSKVGISTKEVMEKAGFTKWFEEDLSDSMYLLGKVLSGEKELQSIKLDLTPLKEAITSDYLSEYFSKVIKNLPRCSKTDEALWIAKIKEFSEDFPACNPTSLPPEQLKKIINENLKNSVKTIPDEADILHDNFFSDSYNNSPANTLRRINVLRRLNTYSYILFFIPFFFILLGALIADSSVQGILRWGGGATAITAVVSLALHSFITSIIKLTEIIPISTINFNYDNELSSIEIILSEKILALVNNILSTLFSKISQISISVLLFGIALIALSFVIKENPPSEIRR